MPANTTPIFPLTPRVAGMSVVGAAAVTLRTAIVGTTGLTLLITAGANGTKVDAIRFVATGTSVAGVLTLWYYDGTTSRIHSEYIVSAVIPSTTAIGYVLETLFDNLQLPATHGLYLSSQVASQLVGALAIGGDY